MTLTHGLADLKRQPRVVTIGTFDGVHIGHQHLVHSAIDRARELGVASLAVTFEPIPAMVLRPESFPGRICTAQEKLRRVLDLGIDEVCVVAFSRDFSQRSAEDFIDELVETASPLELFVGEGFALGRGRAGGIERLAELGQENGFVLRPLQRIRLGDEIVSSSSIRQAVIHGQPDKASTFLGRPFRVSGPVIHSSHYGRQIGFPTANVMPPADLVPVADGIYASRASAPGFGDDLPAMTYVGTRPTVNTGVRQVETHLLDFSGDLYGYPLAVDLLARLRPDETFTSVEAMVTQLRADERATRNWLAAHPCSAASEGQ